MIVGAFRVSASVLAAAIVVSWAQAAAAAQDVGADEVREPPPLHGIYFELPLLDAPLVAQGGLSSPSMKQSLEVTAGSYELLHFGLGKLQNPRDPRWPQRFVSWVMIGVVDMFALWFPPFNAWLHEEWHRATLSRRGISSRNDVYDLQIGADTIAVSRVTDEALTAFKAAHPAEHVRMSAAGMEGELELATALERNTFFRRTEGLHTLLLWLLYVDVIGYMNSCSSGEAARLTNRLNAEEPTIAERDFTGLDCVAWVYDLHRPDEPFAARGVHPSGVGIDRYRTPEDLTPAERDYLRTQARYSFLNLLDPSLLGWDDFTLPVAGAPLRFHASVRRHITSFGAASALQTFVAYRGWNLAVAPSVNTSEHLILPALDVAVLDRPATAGQNLTLSARTGLWLQPARQRFAARDATPGFRIGLRVGYWPASWGEIFAEIEAKSRGWVAGNVYLDGNLSVRSGVAVRAF